MEKVYSTHTLIDRLPLTICSFRKTFYFSLDFTFLSYFACYFLRSWVDFNLNMFQIFKEFQTNFYFIYTFSLSLSLSPWKCLKKKLNEYVRTTAEICDGLYNAQCTLCYTEISKVNSSTNMEENVRLTVFQWSLLLKI